MVHPLIGVHAAIGELGIVAFAWVFVELLDPGKRRIYRAQWASLIGCLAFVASWITGGYYYLVYYGSQVKPLIKAGSRPWAHGIIMETKEHVFLFIPFIAVLTTVLLWQYKPAYRKQILGLCVTLVLLGALMAGWGYMISTGARVAMEAHL